MIKQYLYTIHKWLGLLSGLIVVFISVSGALYVFRDDFFESAHKRAIYVSEIGEEKLQVDSLVQIAQKWFGEEYPISKIFAYSDSSKNYKFTSYKKNQEAVTYSKWMEYDQWLYLNPYTGNVEKALNHKWEFTHIIKRLHAYLLLNPKYGRPLVGIVAGIFLLMLISGIILWWPKPEFRKGSLALILNAPPTTVAISLHKVFGVYGMVLVLLILSTGIIMVFKGNKPALSNQIEFLGKDAHLPQSAFVENPYGTIYSKAQSAFPNSYEYQFIIGKDHAPIELKVYENKQDRLRVNIFKYDKASGECVFANDYRTRSKSAKIGMASYDVHVGAIAKLPGKLLALLGSLIAASLPISGFVIWRNKMKTKKLMSK